MRLTLAAIAKLLKIYGWVHPLLHWCHCYIVECLRRQVYFRSSLLTNCFHRLLM